MKTNFIRPIFEFFPLDPVESKHGAKWEILTDLDENKNEHRYYDGIKRTLQKSYGIYFFYDSRGRALYAGKAEKQCLWKEMNDVYNRSRKEVQQLKIVNHPSSKVNYSLRS